MVKLRAQFTLVTRSDLARTIEEGPADEYVDLRATSENQVLVSSGLRVNVAKKIPRRPRHRNKVPKTRHPR